MKKKILIGSIIAVVILTLVSFSSVVGYSSVKSDSRIASPLFGIRTNRAINKEQDAVTSDYIGKGKAINILLPRRNDKTELVEKFVIQLKMMNDKSFDRFVDFIIKNHNQRFDSQEFNDGEITKSLYHLRENPDVLKSSFLTEKEAIIASNACSMACPSTFDASVECLLLWFGVLIINIIVMILMIPVIEIVIITSFLTIGKFCE